MTCIQEDEDAEGNAEEKADTRLYRYTDGEDLDGVGESLRSGEERERVRERERGRTEHRRIGEEDVQYSRDRRVSEEKAAEDGDEERDGYGDEEQLSAVRRRSF